MDEVKPWIKDYFLNIATTYGSSFDTAPAVEKVRRCQLKKVLTPEPKDYFSVLLSDKEHEVQGRISKEVAEQCLNDAKRDKSLTRHVGSLIEVRYFSPLFIRAEGGPSTSAPRKVLALDIGKAKLRGGVREPPWGSPQPLDNVRDLKEWIHELRKPDGNRDILKLRKEQRDRAEAAKQITEPPEPLSDPEPRPQLATHSPPVAQWKAASTKSPVVERLPMQRYCRKWKKAVPGLKEFAHLLQIPEDARSKILEKQKIQQGKSEPRPSGLVSANGPRNARGALEIGSSPARLSSVPRATTPEEWPTSPGVLTRLYNDRETEMSSDVYSTRQSSPVDIYHDTEMNGIEPQLEPETIPETPQIPPDSQTQHLSPPPPTQPPRPQPSLSSSSNPQVQNHPISPSSIHTSVQAVSGSQLPENPPVWDRSEDVPSNGPTFVLPWTQPNDLLVAVEKPTSESHPTPEKLTTKLPSSAKEPPQSDAPQPQQKDAMAKAIPRVLADSVLEAIEKAFPLEGQGELALKSHDPSTVSPAQKLTVAEAPPPKSRPKPPSRVTQKPIPGPPTLVKVEHLGPSVCQPFQALNRKVPAPEVGPTRAPVIGRNENGAITMVLIPASDDTKLSSSKQSSSSQPVRSSQSLPSSLPVPSSAHPPPSQFGPSSEPQIQHPASKLDASITQEGDSVVVRINDTVVDIETVQDRAENTQSSLEYASTQEGDKALVDVNPQNLTERPTEIEVAVEKAADEFLESPLPQITAIREVSQQSAAEEVDELESDSEAGDHPPAIKRKPKSVSLNPPIKSAKHPQLNRTTKPDATSKSPSKPALRPDPVVAKVPSRSSSKLPPIPFVLIERKRTLAIPTDEPTSPTRKRRLPSPPGEGSPLSQPTKRSKINGYYPPAKTALPHTPRTPPAHVEDEAGGCMSKETIEASNKNEAAHHPVVSRVLRSAKGKERAEGIKGLENIRPSVDAGKKLETVQTKEKKKAPDTGSKRKPSDAFSAQDDSRDAKRSKVTKEPEAQKLGKQLSFVDPDELKRPFRSKSQVRKTPYRQKTTGVAVAAVVEAENDGRTSKYFNPLLYREPEHPQMTATVDAEQAQKAVVGIEENGHGSVYPRPRIDPRKTSKSDPDRKLPRKGCSTSRVPDEPPVRPPPHTRVQKRKLVEAERDPQYPPARKLGSFAPDLNPPSLPGLPGGRLMNKQLREILIRTGKIRTREAKAAGLNPAGR